MKKALTNTHVTGPDGFVLVTALIIMVILVSLGTFALNTTNVELQISGNDRLAKENLFNQENCVTSGKFQFRNWLTTTYLTAPETTASYPPSGSTESNCVSPNNAALVLGKYKVKNIEATGTDIDWDDSAVRFLNNANHPANNYPTLAHRDKPDPVSEDSVEQTGSDPKNFEIRRFVITSYSPEADRNVTVQQGVYKVFNKF